MSARTGPHVRLRAEDRGSATVFACFGLLALVSIVAVMIHFGAVVAGRHRAQSAADLGALAGAAVLSEGAHAARATNTGTPCGRARSIVRRNAGALTHCVVLGDDVVVEVDVTVSGAVGHGLRASAVARAGPAGEPP